MLELAADLSISGREHGQHKKESAENLTSERVGSLKKHDEGSQEGGEGLR